MLVLVVVSVILWMTLSYLAIVPIAFGWIIFGLKWRWWVKILVMVGVIVFFWVMVEVTIGGLFLGVASGKGFFEGINILNHCDAGCFGN